MVCGYELRLCTHVSFLMPEYCTNKRRSSSSKDIDILNPTSHDFKPIVVSNRANTQIEHSLVFPKAI